MAVQKNDLTPEQKAAQEAEEQTKLEAEEKARLEAEEEAKREAAKKANHKDKVVVTFVAPYSRYSRGDVAGFEAAEAERLVKGRVAVKGSKLPARKAEPDTEPKA